jgi:hypothetical protein
MDRAISRRDFLNGVGVVAASTLMPGCSSLRNSDRYDGARATDGYPPTRMGRPGALNRSVTRHFYLAATSESGPRARGGARLGARVPVLDADF